MSFREAGTAQPSGETSLAGGDYPCRDTVMVPDPVEEEPEESSGGVPIALWVVIGVAVAAVAGVAIFLLLRKGKAGVSRPSAARTAGARSSTCPSESACAALFGSTAQRGADSHPGQADPLIGTSQGECQVVFRAGTPGRQPPPLLPSPLMPPPGISFLTDLGSSFGTFLENRQKLAQGVPTRLRPGGRFYLGSPENLMSTGLE